MVSSVSLFALICALGANASPIVNRQMNSTMSGGSTGSAPQVTIYPPSYDGSPVTITGASSAGIDTYLGIPFAQPPVKDLRFVAPQTAVWNTTSFNATTPSSACLQAGNSYGPSSEDCLYLDVHVPAGVNGSTAWLPVMVWVYGGSFVSGSSRPFDPRVILGTGGQTDRPVVFVALNYRLGALGFPSGDEIAANNAGNLGLRDVQKGLEWVQEHIWAFGGNPDQVTVFGESAGAILISLLYLQPDIKLFRSAIMQSGAQSTAPIGPTDSTWQGAYDKLVQFAGCEVGSTNGSTNATTPTGANVGNYSSSFECLKYLPAEQLLSAQAQVRNLTQYALGFVFAPSVDGDLIPDSPHKLLAEGKFARIPYISGNNRDEGTGFVPATLPDNPTLIALAFSTLEPRNLQPDVLSELFTSVYPNVPALGSPFGTGNETFGRSPYFKQVSAILGDAAFQANRRWFLQQSNAHGFDQTWSYELQVTIPALPALGSFHGIDIFYVYGLPILSQLNATEGAFTGGFGSLGGAVAVANFTAANAQLSSQIIDYWLNFAYYTNPNGVEGSTNVNQLVEWPQYGSDLNLLKLDIGNATAVIPDTYRKEQMQFFLDRPTDFNYKRSMAAQGGI
ncbi:Carboxylesterase [Papiliotrema laurentii]|uniref:Carboxylic ester hydrolase n=1 Tax=Papiliotrema laurentii TaxID=5418 RepID=A0AAD9L9P7_PAPLA|nr:Carboxylesterase [Papiliotrema laurentii]